jgi:hypothetical protein
LIGMAFRRRSRERYEYRTSADVTTGGLRWHRGTDRSRSSIINGTHARLRSLRVGAGFFLSPNAEPRADWKFKADDQTSALACGEANVSTMLPYDRTGDRQTESDAASVGVTRAFDPIERFENLLTLAARYPWSLVFDGDDDAFGFGRQACGGAAAIFHRYNGHGRYQPALKFFVRRAPSPGSFSSRLAAAVSVLIFVTAMLTSERSDPATFRQYAAA